jgi:hypothetical protein
MCVQRGNVRGVLPMDLTWGRNWNLPTVCGVPHHVGVARIRGGRSAAAVLFVLALVSCGPASAISVASSPAARAAGETPLIGNLASFHSATFGLSFDYPRAWQPQTYEVASSFTWLVTYLSPQQLHDPCTRSDNQISCGPYDALRRLDPHGVLVAWSGVGFPILRGQDELRGFGGRTTTVGGHRAKLDVQHSPAGAGCGQIGGDELITAAIERGLAGNYFVLTACFRSPSLSATEQEVQSMLDSVKIPTVANGETST